MIIHNYNCILDVCCWSPPRLRSEAHRHNGEEAVQVKIESGTQVASRGPTWRIATPRCEWEQPHTLSWRSAIADDAEWMSGKSRDRLAPVLTEASSWMSDRRARFTSARTRARPQRRRAPHPASAASLAKPRRIGSAGPSQSPGEDAVGRGAAQSGRVAEKVVALQRVESPAADRLVKKADSGGHGPRRLAAMELRLNQPTRCHL